MSYGNTPYGDSDYKYEDEDTSIENAVIVADGEVSDPDNGVDIKFDFTTNDVFITEDRDIEFCSGTYLLRQRLKDLFQKIQGEWVFDMDAGIPLIDIRQKKYSLQSVKSIFIDKILEEKFIKKITSINLDFNNSTGTLDVKFTASTLYGDFIYE
jgi:hypothetical protein